MVRISMKFPRLCLLLTASFWFAVLIVPLVARDARTVESRILEDLKYLAGDECEGRGIYTQGINRAADYLAAELKKLGLKPISAETGYFQPFRIVGQAKLGKVHQLVLHGPQGQRITLERGKHYQVVAFGSAGQVKAPVVFAGFGIISKEPAWDDFAGLDVAGKVVIMLRRLPRMSHAEAPIFVGGGDHPAAALQSKATNAALHKAAAVIFVNDADLAAQNKDELMPFDYTAQSREPVQVPMVHVKRAIVDRMLAAAGTDLKTLEATISREARPRSLAIPGWQVELQVEIAREYVTLKNVIGVLEGKGPLAEETVIIGAHYDHLGYGERGSLARGVRAIHYGADDNASGTAAVLELARRFAEMQDRQGRRLVFIFFSGEEQGLLGSRHYCNHPVFPLENTVVMVNFDMVGRLRDDKLTVYGTGTAKGFDKLVDELGKKHGFQISKVATGFGPSDHAAFYGRKIPVFHFFTGTHPQYHRPTDTVDTINVAGIRRIVDMGEELIAHLATVRPRPEYVAVAQPAKPGATPGRGPRLGIMPNYEDTKEGVLVEDVLPESPAAKAGIQRGDRIVEIAGKPVNHLTAYMAIMAGFKAGDKIEITVLRGEKKLKLQAELR
ncbi:MAG: M28 family peptidase [Gemmatales bacterium]|nr:M28 family peptidase [Gemmatales bacterium]MDW7993417.1 M28 family peptidase [Gemmatales bacterium]